MAGMETVSAAHTLQMYWVISNMTLASVSMQILVVLLSPAILLTLTQTAMPTTAVKILVEWLLMAHALSALVVQERENHRMVADGSNALLMVCGISVARQVVVAHETVPRTAGYRVVLACRIPMVVLL